MKHRLSSTGIIFLCLLILWLWMPTSFAHDKSFAEQGLSIFVTPKRATPGFDHTLHEESLGETGCAYCHHVLDTEKNKLVYSEGEETGCMDCHTSKKQGNILAIREASHQTCTGCHRNMKKTKKTTGPSTCGECHKK
jgi:hypothetical protein